MTTQDYALARRMWHQLEPVHALFWYAPQVFAEAAGLGYDTRTRWPSYFAWRLAPLGPAGPRAAASACYSFSPDMVAAHVPAAWAVATPPRILAARERAVDRMYRALPGGLTGSPGLAEAAELVREAAFAAGTAGRPLGAANADLPWPDAPHLVLWHAINVLREHRGDGHIAALQVAGLDPCEALVSFAAIGAAPEDVFASRGWTAAEWSAARDRLAARGWIDADGTATGRGRDGRDEIEWRTDRLADAPWQALGAGRAQRLYYEGMHSGDWPAPSGVPTGVAVFAEDVAIRRYAEQANNIVHWSDFDTGGHFAALETPDLLVHDIRAFFAALPS